MNSRELLASLRRRWHLVLVAVLLAAAATALTVHSVAPTYQTEASVVLVPPKSTEDPTANRYLSLSGLTQVTSVMIRALNSDATHAAIDSGQADYVVAPDYTTSAPILLITTTGHHSTATSRLARDVVNQVPKVLADLQERLGIAPDARIVAIEITRDSEPTVLQKARIRAGIAVGGGTLALLVFLIGAVDGLLVRRAGRTGKDEGRPDRGGDGPARRGRTAPRTAAAVKRPTSAGPGSGAPERRRPPANTPGPTPARNGEDATAPMRARRR